MIKRPPKSQNVKSLEAIISNSVINIGLQFWDARLVTLTTTDIFLRFPNVGKVRKRYTRFTKAHTHFKERVQHVLYNLVLVVNCN